MDSEIAFIHVKDKAFANGIASTKVTLSKGDAAVDSHSFESVLIMQLICSRITEIVYFKDTR